MERNFPAPSNRAAPSLLWRVACVQTTVSRCPPIACVAQCFKIGEVVTASLRERKCTSSFTPAPLAPHRGSSGPGRHEAGFHSRCSRTRTSFLASSASDRKFAIKASARSIRTRQAWCLAIVVDLRSRSLDELNVLLPIQSQHETLQHPRAVYFVRSHKCLRFGLRARHGKVEVCLLHSTEGPDCPLWKTDRDRGAETDGRLRTGLKSGRGKLKGIGMTKNVERVVERNANKCGNGSHATKEANASPYCPFVLNPFEMLDAVPIRARPIGFLSHRAQRA